MRVFTVLGRALSGRVWSVEMTTVCRFTNCCFNNTAMVAILHAKKTAVINSMMKACLRMKLGRFFVPSLTGKLLVNPLDELVLPAGLTKVC